MRSLRNSRPNRTCTKKYSDYASYKPYLRSDFGKRCGYCGDIDSLCGGVRGFHIDHFRPKSLFDQLKNDYQNLVYACPYCNGAKSNDWPSECIEISVLDDGRGYIDPCDTEFENHFERYDNGRIRPKTEAGKYMFKQMKLGLRRHQIAWIYEQLEKSLLKLQKELSETKTDTPLVKQAQEHLVRLLGEYFKYKGLFEETI